MKFDASIQNFFPTSSPLPTTDWWTSAPARRSTLAVQPSRAEDPHAIVRRSDELARRCEMVCAVVLVICVACTLALCVGQLATL